MNYYSKWTERNQTQKSPDLKIKVIEFKRLVNENKLLKRRGMTDRLGDNFNENNYQADVKGHNFVTRGTWLS
jgi:hypothetical protein